MSCKCYHLGEKKLNTFCQSYISASTEIKIFLKRQIDLLKKILGGVLFGKKLRPTFTKDIFKAKNTHTLKLEILIKITKLSLSKIINHSKMASKIVKAFCHENFALQIASVA